MTVPVIYNPLSFYCAPNAATPDYVTYHDFESWVAYGLLTCWLGSSADNPNEDCYLARPVTLEDVRELRDYFLDAVETVIVSLWKAENEPGEGWLDGDFHDLVIGEESDDEERDDSKDTLIGWNVRLDNDSMMFEMHDGCDGTAIWLSYEAIKDRKKVAEVLANARQVSPGFGKDGDKVWDKLLELVFTIDDDSDGNGTVYHGEDILGEFLDGRFVPSRFLLEKDTKFQKAVEVFVKSQGTESQDDQDE